MADSDEEELNHVFVGLNVVGSSKTPSKPATTQPAIVQETIVHGAAVEDEEVVSAEGSNSSAKQSKVHHKDGKPSGNYQKNPKYGGPKHDGDGDKPKPHYGKTPHHHDGHAPPHHGYKPHHHHDGAGPPHHNPHFGNKPPHPHHGPGPHHEKPHHAPHHAPHHKPPHHHDGPPPPHHNKYGNKPHHHDGPAPPHGKPQHHHDGPGPQHSHSQNQNPKSNNYQNQKQNQYQNQTQKTSKTEYQSQNNYKKEDADNTNKLSQKHSIVPTHADLDDDDDKLSVDSKTSSKVSKVGPEVCSHYLAGNCKFGDNCHKSHPPICTHYQQGKCKFGDNCTKLHIDSSNKVSTQKTPKKESVKIETKNDIESVEDKDALIAQLLKKNQELEKEVEDKQHFNKTNVKLIQEMKKADEVFKERKAEASSVDLVIVLDLTKSMDAWIDVAKSKTVEAINIVTSKFTGSKARVGFVGYRDHCDGNNRLVIMPFTEDVSSVIHLIAKQPARGGGDLPEDIPGALQEAINMDWGHLRAKCMILVTDAPCHGTRYHDLGASGDWDISIKAMEANPLNIENQMKLIANMGIDFCMIEVKPKATKKMVDLLRASFEEAPLPKDGVRRKFSTIPLDNVDDVSVFEPTLVELCTTSIESSISRTRSALMKEHGKELMKSKAKSKMASIVEDEDCEEEEEEDEDERVVSNLTKAELDWAAVRRRPAERAMRHTFLIPPNQTIDWSNPTFKPVQQSTTVKIDENYFAEGAMRTAHGMIDMKMNKQLVGKIYKKRSKQGKLDIVQRDVKAQVISKALAKEFSKQSAIKNTVDFIMISYYDLLDRDSSDPFKYVTAEPLVDGEYKKYSNNGGWQEMSKELAHAFSHFTYQVSSCPLSQLHGLALITTT